MVGGTKPTITKISPRTITHYIVILCLLLKTGSAFDNKCDLARGCICISEVGLPWFYQVSALLDSNVGLCCEIVIFTNYLGYGIYN